MKNKIERESGASQQDGAISSAMVIEQVKMQTQEGVTDPIGYVMIKEDRR